MFVDTYRGGEIRRVNNVINMRADLPFNQRFEDRLENECLELIQRDGFGGRDSVQINDIC